MALIQMIALAEMQERERDMRARRQSHELAESRRANVEAHGIRERIARFAGTAFPHRATTAKRGATCAAC
jgi:hypothetical protein